MHSVEPWSYLRDPFCLITEWPVHRILELAPLNWKNTASRPDVEALLEASLYRRLTLSPT